MPSTRRWCCARSIQRLQTGTRASAVVEVSCRMSLLSGAARWRDAPGRASRRAPVCLRGGRRGLGLGLLGARRVEELDAAGDHLELLTAAAVLGLPLGVV